MSLFNFFLSIENLVKTLAKHISGLEQQRSDDKWARMEIRDSIEFKRRLTIEAFKKYDPMEAGVTEARCAQEIMCMVNSIISEMNVGIESTSSKSGEIAPKHEMPISPNVDGK